MIYLLPISTAAFQIHENERLEVKKLEADGTFLDTRLKKLEDDHLSTSYVDERIQQLDAQEKRLADEHYARVAKMEDERKRHIAEVHAAGVAQQRRIEFLQRKEEALETNEMYQVVQ